STAVVESTPRWSSEERSPRWISPSHSSFRSERKRRRQKTRLLTSAFQTKLRMTGIKHLSFRL
ncbi:hypothetical protein CEXT_271771, partial [Caerostris extrusa]